jgi:hypothetical protein
MHDTYTLLLSVPFKIVSPCINIPLPAFLKVVEAAPEGTSWNSAQLLCHSCLNGLNVSIVMAFHYLSKLWE